MKKNRITYYDSLKGIAIIGVVFIHTLKYKDTSTVDISIVFRNLINFSVSLFLALSGFFLAEKKIHNKNEYFNFLKKRIPRVYLPYVVWSAVYILINIVTIKDISIGNQLHNFLIFQTRSIFYFVALIIQFYIVFPLLQKYLSKKLLIAAALISCLASITIYIFQYYTQLNLPLILYAGNVFTWGLFFVLGMYLKTNKIKIEKSLAVGLSVIALGLSVAEGYFHLQHTGNVGNAVSAVKVSSFIYSSLIIILFLNYNQPKRTFLHDLGKVSYAIYLLHLLVLMVVMKVVLHFNLNYFSLIAEIIIGISTVVISYLICVVLRKIHPIISTKYLGI